VLDQAQAGCEARHLSGRYTTRNSRSDVARMSSAVTGSIDRSDLDQVERDRLPSLRVAFWPTGILQMVLVSSRHT
jgi:hypothetical protein